MRIKNYINGVEGVAAGSIATANIIINRRYHGLKLFPAATVGGNPSVDPTAIINYVRLYVNGSIIRDMTPAQYLAIAALRGLTIPAGSLPIFFSEPWRASVLGEELVSWDLFGQVKCTMEISFKATAVAPSLSIMAAYDFGRNFEMQPDGSKKYLLQIIKHKPQNWNANAGVYDVTNLNTLNPIQSILLAVTAGTITSVEVYRDNDKIHEGLTAQNSAFLKDYGLDASQFAYPIAFDYTQQLTDAMIVNKDLLVKVTSTNANTLTIISEERMNGYFA